MTRERYMKCDLSCTAETLYLNTATFMVFGSYCNSKTGVTDDMARTAAHTPHLAFPDKFADPGLV